MNKDIEKLYDETFDTYSLAQDMSRGLAVVESKSFIDTHFIAKKDLEAEIEKMKMVGKFLHDGDIYTPRDVNNFLNDFKDKLL